MVLAVGCAKPGASATTPSANPPPAESSPSSDGQAEADAPDDYDPEPAFCPADGEALAGATVPKDQRYAPAVRRFSEIESALDKPIEACGVHGQTSYLKYLECDDGNRVFATLQAAHAARVGSKGPQGRCGAVVDLYEVQCPEQTYSIYMDLYKCTSDEGNPLAASILPVGVAMGSVSVLVDSAWSYRPVEGMPGAVQLRTGDVKGIVAAHGADEAASLSDVAPLAKAGFDALDVTTLTEGTPVDGVRVFRSEDGGEVTVALIQDEPTRAIALVRGPAEQVDVEAWQAPLATVRLSKRPAASSATVFRAGDIQLDKLDLEPRAVVVPRDWSAYGDSWHAEARFRGRYDFVRLHNVAHRTNGRTPMRMAWDAADSFDRPGTQVEVVFDGPVDGTPNSHALVLDFGEARLASVVVARGDWTTTTVLIGDRDDVEAAGGAMLAVKCAVESDRVNEDVKLVAPTSE